MKTQYKVPLYWAILAFAILTINMGCASIPAPQTTDQKVAYAQATLTGLVNSTAALTESGRLSKQDAQAVFGLAEQAGTALKAARGVEGQDALSYLRTAQTVLIELNRYLLEKQK